MTVHLPEVPECVPKRDYGITQRLAVKILSLCGWTITGQLPQQPKFILAVAPHTSNWDFFVAIAAMFSLNLKVQFLGKASIFVWPIKSLLHKLGGIAIDRAYSHGVVKQTVNAFNQHQQFVLGLAPEGTRSKTVEWKTGFLQIAYQANIAIVPVSLDFHKKQVEFHPAVRVSGNIEQELQAFKAIFSEVCAKNPQAV